MDHLYQIQGIGPETEPMLEGWSTLAALARETTRIRLGTVVTGVTYRNPALLAKTATTLDVISGGRAILGLGAGLERTGAHRLRLRLPARRASGWTASTRRSRSSGRCSRRSARRSRAPLPDRGGLERAATDPAGRTAGHGRRRR